MVQLYKRKGSDVLVNTQTNSTQSTSQIAQLQGGGYVVVWNDSSGIGGDASSTGIKAQRFDADGNKVGAEFLVNTIVTSGQFTASVVTLTSGRFLITWSDNSLSADDASSTAVRAQLFEANGTPVGSEFLVNTATTGMQTTPTVVELSGGRFAITWQDASGIGGDNSASGIKAQLFDANGAKVGGEILVNTTILGGQISPNSTALAGGGFAVTWVASGSNGGVVSLQLFDDNGVKVGGEITVNTTAMRSASGNVVASLASGFVVVWAQGDFPITAGLSATDIRAQLFDANGAKIGGEIAINSTTDGTQGSPDVDALPGGGFIVTWQGPGAIGEGTNIFARIYDSTGAAVGQEFVLTSSTIGDQTVARVEVLPSGDIVVTWTEGSTGAGNDGSGSAVRTQTFSLASAAPTDLALSDLTVSETQVAGLSVATLSTTSEALNSTFTYTIVSDSSGGAFGISGSQLIVADNSLLDFETQATIEVRIRTTDLNGNFYEETLVLNVEDEVLETRYAAETEWTQPPQTQPVQGVSVVTPLAGGGYLVSWRSDYHGNAISGQLHTADGSPVGDRLDLVSSGAFAPGSAIALASGGFLLTYVGQGNGAEIFGRIFDSAGAPVGAAFTISAGATPSSISTTADPVTATLVSGASIVSWFELGEDGGKRILGQMFDAAGAKLGGIVRLDDGGASDHYILPNVVALAGGGFVVTWREDNSAFEGYHAQLFDAAGAKLGTSFEITPGVDESARDVAALAGGGFVVVFVENGDPDWQASFQLFDSNGNPVGGATAVSGPIADVGGGQNLDVVGLPDGGFALVWSGSLEGTEHEGGEIRAQVFSATGQAAGDAFVVNQTLAGDQVEAAIAVLSTGALAVSWNSVTPHYQFSFDILQSTVVTRVLTLVEGLTPPSGPTEGPDTLNGTADADTIDGLGGDDVINGLGGDDVLTGGAGDDEVHGGDDNDKIFELNGGNDELFGDGGNDSLSYRSGSGAMTVLLDGGAGDDVLDARFARDDTVTTNGGSGADWILTGLGLDVTVDAGDGADLVQINYVYGTEITLGAGADLVAFDDLFWFYGAVQITDFTAGDGGDAINLLGLLYGSIPNHWNDPFDTGAIKLYQSGADAVLEVDTDFISGAATVYVYLSNVQASSLTAYNLGYAPDGSAGAPLSLTGSSGVDFLTGHSVNDTITGNGGNDVLFGASGDDFLGGGDGTDALYGQFGNDTLDGNAGADRLAGGGGNDLYYVDDAGDVIVEGEIEGTDIVYASVGYTLNAGAWVELLTTASIASTFAIDMTGNELSNTIWGNNGSNTLSGGIGGQDTLVGFFGNDIYLVNNITENIVENAGEGTDIVYVNSSYTLSAHASIELLSTYDIAGTQAFNLTGNNLDNTIWGNRGNNQLSGGIGGQDTLVGFLGDDIYLINNITEVVVENAGEGTDIVYVNSSYTLSAGASIELLSTYDIAGTQAFNMTGNELDNTIWGNRGNNTLSGGIGGTDTLVGFLGDDIYLVNNGTEFISELANEGSDIVYAFVNYTLSTGASIELLTTASIGGTNAQNLTGNELANTIWGNNGANVLDGKGGSDTLNGFGGADTFAFTTALVATNVDLLVDFTAGTDTLALDDAIFAGIGTPGAFNAAAFVSGSAAADADDRIVYNQATGQLFYDADGNGAGAAVLFATLQGNPALTASDFAVI